MYSVFRNTNRLVITFLFMFVIDQLQLLLLFHISHFSFPISQVKYVFRKKFINILFFHVENETILAQSFEFRI